MARPARTTTKRIPTITPRPRKTVPTIPRIFPAFAVDRFSGDRRPESIAASSCSPSPRQRGQDLAENQPEDAQNQDGCCLTLLRVLILVSGKLHIAHGRRVSRIEDTAQRPLPCRSFSRPPYLDSASDSYDPLRANPPGAAAPCTAAAAAATSNNTATATGSTTAPANGVPTKSWRS